eukprot:TRINITY_DN2046_c0_g5_i1.p1 TRINITY_DN2046_c0_g5~~TRINITY_DN2046_c0_g5_i1.p1  ORF type:complete len:242 (-),score=72.51 TRINITY_DN2046_c0_g5_i1:81-806(-)
MKLSLTLLVFLCATSLAAKAKKCHKGNTESKAEVKMTVEAVQDFDETKNIYIDTQELVEDVEKAAHVFQKEIIHKIDDLLQDMYNDMVAGEKGVTLGGMKGLRKFKEKMPKEFEEEMLDLFNYLEHEIEKTVYHTSAEILGREVSKMVMQTMLETMVDEASEKLEEDMAKVYIKHFGFKGHETDEEISRIIDEKIHGKLKHVSKKELEGVADRMIKKGDSVGEAFVHELKPEGKKGKGGPH